MIIDSHTHMPSPEWGKHECFFKSVASAVGYLRKAGVDRAVFNTWQGVLAETADDLNTANAQALELYRKYPDFLYPGAVIHPLFPEESRNWLNRFRDAGLMWVGELVHYKCGLEFAEPPWLKLFEYCASSGHVIQLHNSEKIIDVAAEFPDMPIVCSHINIPLLDSLAQKENIRLDISGGCGGLAVGAIEAALKAFGIERLLFGTDFTNYEPEVFIGRVKSAVPNNKDKEKIYSQNIIKLLAQAGSLPIC